jgi:hypothetical protein
VGAVSAPLTLRAHRIANRCNATAWERYETHRARVTAALAGAAPADGRGRLVLLGAGNANDIDLDRLADRYAELLLVDLDEEALRRGMARISRAACARVKVAAPHDLSGVLGLLPRWGRHRPQPHELAAAVDAAVAANLRALGAEHDVVASCCVASQIGFGIFRATRDDKLDAALREPLATIHARTIAALLRPGGRALS